jgi:hypothetical protein
MTNAELIAYLTRLHGEPETMPSGILCWSGEAFYDPASPPREAWYVDFGVIAGGMSAADAYALMTQQGDE